MAQLMMDKKQMKIGHWSVTTNKLSSFKISPIATTNKYIFITSFYVLLKQFLNINEYTKLFCRMDFNGIVSAGIQLLCSRQTERKCLCLPLSKCLWACLFHCSLSEHRILAAYKLVPDCVVIKCMLPAITKSCIKVDMCHIKVLIYSFVTFIVK